MASIERYYEFKENVLATLGRFKRRACSLRAWRSATRRVLDYYYDPICVSLQRVCLMSDTEKVLGSAKLLCSHLSSVPGHISTQIFVSRNQQRTTKDPSGIGILTQIVCNILIVSNWDSRWQWENYSKRCMDMKYDKEIVADEILETRVNALQGFHFKTISCHIEGKQKRDKWKDCFAENRILSTMVFGFSFVLISLLSFIYVVFLRNENRDIVIDVR